MHILVFQHIACEHPGIFRDFMSEDGVTWDAVELDEGESIPAFDGYDALIVMGGPMDIWQTDANPWLVAEIQAIRKWVVEYRRPYFGFCLGHQLLAAALGGEVGAARQPEIGVLPVAVTAAGTGSPFLENIPQEFDTLQWHSAEVTRAPDDAKVLGSSPACEVNAMSWGGHAFSVQFHVEINSSTVSDWGDIPEYSAALEKALGKGALQQLDAAAAQKMEAFNSVARTLYKNFHAIAAPAENAV